MSELSELVKRLRLMAKELPAETQPADAELLNEAADEIEGQEQSFDLRWNADMRAIKRWQAAHPGKELVWPDHADLVVWLMEQLDG
jgi:hypothetical protein